MSDNLIFEGNENFKIRTAGFDDAKIIADFNYSMAIETENKELDKSVLEQGVLNLLSDKSKGLYYVCEIDSTVIGQLMITKEWSDWRNGYFWWIQSVYVKPEFRSKNIFKSLYKHVEQLCREDTDAIGLRLYVEKENEKARKVYEKMGMKKTNYLLYEIEKNN